MPAAVLRAQPGRASRSARYMVWRRARFIGVLQHREVGREVQGELPAGLSRPSARRPGGSLRHRRAGRPGRARLHAARGVRVGGVEHVVREKAFGQLPPVRSWISAKRACGLRGSSAPPRRKSRSALSSDLLARRRTGRANSGAGGHGLVLLRTAPGSGPARPEVGHAAAGSRCRPRAARGVSATAFRWPTTPQARPQPLGGVLPAAPRRSVQVAGVAGFGRAVTAASAFGQQHVAARA